MNWKLRFRWTSITSAASTSARHLRILLVSPKKTSYTYANLPAPGSAFNNHVFEDMFSVYSDTVYDLKNENVAVYNNAANTITAPTINKNIVMNKQISFRPNSISSD